MVTDPHSNSSTGPPPRPNLLDVARRAADAGLCVLPPEQNGSKKPLGATWKEWQHQRPLPSIIDAYYENGRTGLGFVTGAVSARITPSGRLLPLEVLDIDLHAILPAFLARGEQAGLAPLLHRVREGYSEQTPNGAHFFYYCAEIEGNQKLARRLKQPAEMRDSEDKVQVLIETRGEGGFIVAAPSYGPVNAAGVYTVLDGDVATIAVITPEERAALLDLARSFDEMPRMAMGGDRPASVGASSRGDRPGDTFNAATDWLGLLEPYGWRFVYEQDGEKFLRRPGKDRDISASVNYRGNDLLKVWSTSTVFDTERTYDRFCAYAVLEHGGDLRAAARALAALGHGRRVVRELNGHVPAEEAPPPPNGHGPVEAVPAPDAPDAEPPLLRYRLLTPQQVKERPEPEWLIKDRILRDSIGMICADKGSFKSFLVLDLVLQIARRGFWLGQPVLTHGPCVYVTAEGSAGLKLRILAWEQHHDLDAPETAYTLTEAVQLLNSQDSGDLLAAIAALPEKPVFIAFDTLARMFVGHEENSNMEMGLLVAKAEQLKRATGAVVCFVHHTNKNGGTRGASSLPDGVDWAIDLEREGDIVKVSCSKQKDADEFASIDLVRQVVELENGWTSMVLVSVDGAMQTPADRTADRVYTLLVETFDARGATTTNWEDVCEAAGIAHTSFFRARKVLVESGRVVADREGRGAYYRPADGTPTSAVVSTNPVGTERLSYAETKVPPELVPSGTFTDDSPDSGGITPTEGTNAELVPSGTEAPERRYQGTTPISKNRGGTFGTFGPFGTPPIEAEAPVQPSPAIGCLYCDLPLADGELVCHAACHRNGGAS